MNGKLRAAATAILGAALSLAAGCGSSVGYSTSRVHGPLAHRADVVVADIVDGRGYSTPLIDGHTAQEDLGELREAVRQHARVLGVESVALDPPDAPTLEQLMARAAERHVAAVILLRVRHTGYGGALAGIHRAAAAMSSFVFLGLLPAIVGIILDSIPASEQFATSVVEAAAVDPATRTLIAQATLVGTQRDKVSGWTFAPADELGGALRNACDDAFRRLIASVDRPERPQPAVPFDGARFVLGQKLHVLASPVAAMP